MNYLLTTFLITAVFFTASCGGSNSNHSSQLADPPEEFITPATTRHAKAITEIEFEDTIFESCVLTHADANGWITTDQVTALDCSLPPFSAGNAIHNLQGIEAFYALTTLDIDHNRLTTINLESNTALINLSLSGNLLITLDLGKNTALQTLRAGSNQINSLDLSNNVALIELSVAFSPLVAINISKNTELKSVNLSYGELSSLDVSHNTKLVDLRLASNHLKEVGVSNNTALTSLILSVNELTNIDVSKNTLLTTLLLSGNKLNTINLSNNSSLTSVGLNENPLSSETITYLEMISDEGEPSISYGPYPVICTADYQPGIIVYIFDKESNLHLPGEATVTLRDGDYVEELNNQSFSFPDPDSAHSPFPVKGAHERIGVYEIAVKKEGYLDWYEEGIVVTKNECHVNTVIVNAYLAADSPG